MSPQDAIPRSLFDILTKYPALAQTVPFDHFIMCLNLLRHLKERVSWSQHHAEMDPPENLPLNIHNFVCDAISQDDNTVKLLWQALKWIAWHDPEAGSPMANRRSEYLLPLFLKYGPANGVGGLVVPLWLYMT
jgi:hypothetical protein